MCCCAGTVFLDLSKNWEKEISKEKAGNRGYLGSQHRRVRKEEWRRMRKVLTKNSSPELKACFGITRGGSWGWSEGWWQEGHGALGDPLIRSSLPSHGMGSSVIFLGEKHQVWGLCNLAGEVEAELEEGG